MPLNGKRLSAEEALHLILETTDQDSDSELSDVDILTVDPPAPTATKVTEPEPEYCTFISSESDFHELKPALKPARSHGRGYAPIYLIEHITFFFTTIITSQV